MSRRRYRWNPDTQAMEEVGADWTDAERRASTATEELTYGKLGKATDGTDISTRSKHREHMKRNGLALTSDFTNTWQKQAVERQEVASGRADRAERRETIGRALHEARRRK